MALPLKRSGADSFPVTLPDEVVDEPDEPGCNACDGFVYVGDTCESCGLKGSIPREDKRR